MSIQVTEILASMANFLIFFLIVKKFFFKKITAVMEQRNATIRTNIDKANADRAQAEELIRQAEEINRKSRDEGSVIINQYKKKAEDLYEDIVADARDEAKLIVQRGTVDADRELDQARRVMRQNVVEMATLLSRKAIGEDAREETHVRLVDEIIGRMGEA